MIDLMTIEKMLSGNAVLVVNEPRETNNGWIFPCYIHKEAYKNGAIGRAVDTLRRNGIEPIFGMPDKGEWGNLNVHIFEREQETCSS